MKTKYSFLLLFLFSLNFIHAQSPCSGAPGSNTILPGSTFTLCSGSNATLNLANTYSTSGLTFSWSSSSTSTVGPWTPINGANSRSFISPPLTANMFFMVTITCTNSGQSITVPVSVSIVACYTACNGTPSNTIVPATQTICAGDSVKLGFAQTYSLTTGNSFQWFSSSASTGPFSAINGATLSGYTSGTLSTTMYYNAVVTCSNGGSSFTVTPVAVNVVSCTSCFGAPGSNTIVGPSTVCAGSSATLSLAQTYTNSGITYQWRNSTVSMVGPFSPIPGGTLSTLVTPTLNTNTYFSVVITCTNNSTQSITVVHSISVVPCPTACVGYPPNSNISSSQVTVCAGASATMALSNNYNNISGLSFSWAAAPAATGPYTIIPGASGQTYTSGPLNAQTYFQAIITCTSINASYTTSPFSVNIVTCTGCFGAPGPNTITPNSPTICIEANALLSIANTYTGSGITYSWSSSTVSSAGPFNTISGANGPTYSTPGLSNTTFYNLIITCTNSGQSIQVNTPVYIIPCSTTACSGTPGSNTILPVNHTVCAGYPASMSLATNYTASGYQYQWSVSNLPAGTFTAIPGATLAAYTQPAQMVTQYFQLVITCTASSQTLALQHTITAFVCSSVSENSWSENGFRIYPNPVEEIMTIDFSRVVNGKLIIEDISGREIMEIEIKDKRTLLSVSEFNDGIYFIKFRSGNLEQVIKFVKQ